MDDDTCVSQSGDHQWILVEKTDHRYIAWCPGCNLLAQYDIPERMVR